MRNTWQKTSISISIKLITDKALLGLNIHILAIKYLKTRAFYFTKITRDNAKTNQDGKKAEIVSDSKKEIKKKNALRKKKMDIQALLVVTACLFTFAVCMFVLGLFILPYILMPMRSFSLFYLRLRLLCLYYIQIYSSVYVCYICTCAQIIYFSIYVYYICAML